MVKRGGGCSLLLLSMLLLVPPMLHADELIIRVHLFRGVQIEGRPGLTDVTVMMPASHPALETLKARAGRPHDEFTTAALDALLETQNLRTVDDVLEFEKHWNGSESRLSQGIRTETSSFFFVFTPARLSPQTLKLRTVFFVSKEAGGTGQKGDSPAIEMSDALSAGKAGGRAEKILEMELSLTIGEPIIIGVPTRQGNQAYFLMIMPSVGGDAQDSIGFAGGPRAVQTARPVYPDELRRQGIEGQVELQVGVDETGSVRGVRVIKSLHPYLDHSAVQALKLWKFEPVIQNGKAVPAVITTVVNFSRDAYRLAEEAAANKARASPDTSVSIPATLAMILEKSAAYCQKLTSSALQYICEETIRDIFYNFTTKQELEKSTTVVTLVSGAGSISQLGISFLPFHNIKRTEKNEYVCDYLLVKRAERIEDRRIILKENGRLLPDRNKILEERRLSALLPFLAPVKLVGRERQPLFIYRLVKTDTIRGQAAFVIEARPKIGDPGGIESGKVWIGRRDFSVLRIETTGVPLDGYERVLEELIRYNLKPKFVTEYSYGIAKNGLAFPSRAEIRVDYPAWDSPGSYVEKIRTSVKYDKYKFFTVETESAIRKSPEKFGK